MALEQSLARLAAALTPDDGGQTIRVRLGVVTTVTGGVASVRLGGDTIAAPHLDGPTLTAGDTVALLLVDGSPLILGRIAGVPDYSG